MKKEKLKLYFIALVPDEPVYSEIKAFKTEFADRFNSKAALRSPPHITLHMPIQWQEEKEGKLISALNILANNHQPVEVALKGFGAFTPRVIYVNVTANEALNELQGAVQKMARSIWHIYPKSAFSRPFTPHITIAFRDLKKPDFFKAWEEFAHKTYVRQFLANNICLLKHDGSKWDILHKSSLLGN